MTTSAAARLPDGFEVRIRDDVTRLGDGRVLVGGSPLRAIRLSSGAMGLIDRDRVRVVDPRSGALARRLLDANVADPVLLAMVPADSMTVVIPVRDRPEQLDRALAALHPLPTVVVDDGSKAPEAVATVAARHGARLVPLQVNLGPAGARNAGLATVQTPYVAFVDSDVDVTADALMRLAQHFADPCVALVGPRVVSVARSARPRWHERYDESASSLDLGVRACSVRPGAAVAWLPSACVVGRVDLLADGFDGDLRIGEDVDLVWRLVAAGHTVRYDPSVLARHDTRPTLTGWLGRKFAYGTGGAVLAQRHGAHTAVAQLSPAMALAAGALLVRRRWSVPIAAVCLARGARSLATSLPDPVITPRLVGQISARGLGWALRQESSLLLRHWWPAALAAAVWSRSIRRAIVTATVVDLIAATLEGVRLRPIAAFFGRRIDDLAYGGGLWWGSIRARSPRALAVRLVRSIGISTPRLEPTAISTAGPERISPARSAGLPVVHCRAIRPPMLWP
ncbi:Mycofactocin system glycosyltransferase [Alloactinosynnema sp. L-07]|nr:mycofactocin biosynthesis glycosyltransferase MftF [Alloactinosynnema sp. L-07]CRK56118.1 Mycofactocin system glycosyltransferase [Alloactinosynnema sp. L-07]